MSHDNSFFNLINNFVIVTCVFLEDVFGDISDFDFYGAVSHSDLDHVADLDIIRSLDDIAVDGNSACIARLVGDSPAFYQASDFEVLVNSQKNHLSICNAPEFLQ